MLYYWYPLDKMKKISNLFFVGMIIIIILFVYNHYHKQTYNYTKIEEGFYNYNAETSGENISSPFLLLDGIYPLTNKKRFTTTDYKNIWKDYPAYPPLQFSSYIQTTNNERYNKNPDIANAVPCEFNGIFYKSKPLKKSNIILPLPPVITSKDEVRIGYFNTRP